MSLWNLIAPVAYVVPISAVMILLLVIVYLAGAASSASAGTA